MQISRSDQGDQTTLHITGKLDVATASGCDALFGAVVAEGRKRVTLDLSGLEEIDSSGVAKVVSLYKRLKQLGGEFHLAGVGDQPLAIFRLLRFDALFPELK
ncbi:STAS domain-containing protein [Nannocystis punicea]|uniref:STAS domain-containing protein n=1 Tax=Nannocystis punicea TaxID=2995304 RepID=A0ABY7H2V5_9BACT|nr:STAS domain-containing protein [Nannocystis poenicansa]WAS93599.1 STAS domain-containing protein [Nannocystis poenicansa]